MPDAGSTVLVTGASGFVGSHLVERLAGRGLRVRAFLRKASNPRWLSGSSNIEIHRGGFDDRAALERSLDGVNTVFHLAAVTSAPRHADNFAANRHSTQGLVDAVRHASPNATFVLCSTQAAAGPSREGKPVTESDPPRPISPYGQSKLEAEQIVLSSGLHAVVVRPPTVYGPRDRDVLEMFRWATWGLAPAVGPHDQKLSVVHVHDLVSGLVKAAAAPSGSIYFLTDGKVHLRSNLVKYIAAAVQKSPLGFRIPVPLALSYAHFAQVVAGLSGSKPLLTPSRIRDFCEPDWTCDDSRARRELGYSSIVEIQDGMIQTARWYREQKWI